MVVVLAVAARHLQVLGAILTVEVAHEARAVVRRDRAAHLRPLELVEHLVRPEKSRELDVGGDDVGIDAVGSDALGVDHGVRVAPRRPLQLGGPERVAAHHPLVGGALGRVRGEAVVHKLALAVLAVLGVVGLLDTLGEVAPSGLDAQLAEAHLPHHLVVPHHVAQPVVGHRLAVVHFLREEALLQRAVHPVKHLAGGGDVVEGLLVVVAEGLVDEGGGDRLLHVEGGDHRAARVQHVDEERDEEDEVHQFALQLLLQRQLLLVVEVRLPAARLRLQDLVLGALRQLHQVLHRLLVVGRLGIDDLALAAIHLDLVGALRRRHRLDLQRDARRRVLAQLHRDVRVGRPDRAALVVEHAVLRRDVPVPRRVLEQVLEGVILLQLPEDLVLVELDAHLVAGRRRRLLDQRRRERLVAQLRRQHLHQHALDAAVELRHRHPRLRLLLRLARRVGRALAHLARRDLVEHRLQPRVLGAQLLLRVRALLLHQPQPVRHRLVLGLGGLERRLDLFQFAARGRRHRGGG